MKYEIKNRWDSKVLFTAETASLALAVEAAVKSGANLQGADLQGADLRSAYLQGAYLQGADLQGADLRSAYLQGAYLQGAYLRSAYLQGAYLQGAYLRSAYLQGAYLQGADLQGADLRSAYLQGADLQGAVNSELAQAQTSIVPEGNLVGWKKCRNNVIVKLLIPQHARRSNATGRKCRAEYVKVLRVYGADKGISQHDGVTQYVVGQEVKCDTWNEDRWIECGGGIHFWLTRVEAENY